MALIHIKSDGSFEAVAAVSTQDVRAQKALIKKLEKEYATCQKIDGLKAEVERIGKTLAKVKADNPHVVARSTKSAPWVKRRDATKAKITKLKATLTNPKQCNVANAQKRVAAAKAKLLKMAAALKPGQLSKLRDHSLMQVAPAKDRLTRGNKTGDPRRNPTRMKSLRTVPRKVSFDTDAKRAATQAAREIKGELNRLGKEALAPAKKPAAGVTKHAAPANSAVQGVLKVINQLKRDIAGGLTGTKLAHAKAELAKQRSSLRLLRKGQSAKNQAAVTKTPATKNMGKAKPKASAATPMDLKELRAKMTELHKKVMAEKDPTKKAALEKRYKASVAKFKKLRLVK